MNGEKPEKYVYWKDIRFLRGISQENTPEKYVRWGNIRFLCGISQENTPEKYVRWENIRFLCGISQKNPKKNMCIEKIFDYFLKSRKKIPRKICMLKGYPIFTWNLARKYLVNKNGRIQNQSAWPSVVFGTLERFPALNLDERHADDGSIPRPERSAGSNGVPSSPTWPSHCAPCIRTCLPHQPIPKQETYNNKPSGWDGQKYRFKITHQINKSINQSNQSNFPNKTIKTSNQSINLTIKARKTTKILEQTNQAINRSYSSINRRKLSPRTYSVVGVSITSNSRTILGCCSSFMQRTSWSSNVWPPASSLALSIIFTATISPLNTWTACLTVAKLPLPNTCRRS